MTSLTDQPRAVTGGVDTHKDLHVAAVVDSPRSAAIAGIATLETVALRMVVATPSETAASTN